MTRKVQSAAERGPGSASRPLDDAERDRLREWCRAHDLEPRKGDRRDERDAALRQWAGVEVQDYKPRDPRMGLDVLRDLFRESAGSHTARCCYRNRLDIVKPAGARPVLRLVVESVPTHVRGADVLATRRPGRVLADWLPQLRFYVRDPGSEARLWAAANAIRTIGTAYAVQPAFPRAAITAARSVTDPKSLLTPAGRADLVDRIAMHSVSLAFEKVRTSVSSSPRSLVDARVYALIERMVGVSEGVLRRDVQAIRDASGS